MNNIRYKLTLTMIATMALLFLAVVFLINYYQQNYILNQAEIALLNEAKYFQDNQSFMTAEEDEARFFDVDIIAINPNYNDKNFESATFYRYEDYFFNRLFFQGQLNVNQVKKVSSEFANYYAMSIIVTDPAIIEYILNDWQTEEDNVTHQNVQSISMVLSVDISASTNIINNLNAIFAVVFLLAIAISGIVGIYMGTRLEDSERKLKHFFENASHELKTPLMSIQGYADGVKSNVIEDHTMAMDVILKQSQKMSVLVDEILNIAKLDSKGYRLKREFVDLIDIIEATIDEHQVVAEQNAINMTFKCNAENSEVVADSLQLYKAINTVVSNAVKFAETKVAITLTEQKKSFLIAIYNDGMPIEQAELNHIFDRFYSGNHASSGIGLAMAKQIITLSGGRISVANATNGVTFNIQLSSK